MKMIGSNDGRQREARKAAEKCARVLKERYGAREVYLFGSLAGQSPWHRGSDIDLAVEGLAPQHYFAALSTLYELLPEGLELDLIPIEDAPPQLVARIRGEVKMPEDPKEALKTEIEGEVNSLVRIVNQAKLLLQKIDKPPSFIEIDAGGKLVHDFYTGVERVFERIAVRLGPGLPVGSGWHTLLLRSMESPVEGVRPALIDHDLALCLLDYLRFRHLFRHSYGYELQWDRLGPLVQGLDGTLTRLRNQIDRFMKTI